MRAHMLSSWYTDRNKGAIYYIRTYSEANQRYKTSASFPLVVKISVKDKDSSGNVR